MNPTTSMYQVTRVIWYVFYAIEVLLFLRLIMKLLGANPGAGFTDFIYGLSQIFVSPFQYVFSAPSMDSSVLELSTVLAMIVYWIIAWGIVKLIAMNRRVSETEARVNLEDQDNA